MNRISPYIKTLFVAASIFVLDAFILNQGFVAVILILMALFVFFPVALLVRRRDRRKYRRRLVKIAIYVIAGVAVLGCNEFQNWLADQRAIAIGNACLKFHAKYKRYPDRLDELVPDFLPSVPVAKYTPVGNHFAYSNSPQGGEPMLFYEAFPPFGRRFYHMESGAWGYLD